MTEWPERSEWIEGDPGPEGDAFVGRMHGMLVTHGATHHGRGCSMLN